LIPARSEHLSATRRILASADLPVEGLEDQFGDGYRVVSVAGRIVGAGGIEVYGRYGLLRSVAVEDSQRGTGLGRRIVENRLDWAREHGLVAVYLLTTTAPDFFSHLGFRVVERDVFPLEVRQSREFVEVCPDSAVAMAIEL